MNMGQMVDDVKLALDCKIPVSFFGRTGGVIPSPNEVLEDLRKLPNAVLTELLDAVQAQMKMDSEVTVEAKPSKKGSAAGKEN